MGTFCFDVTWQKINYCKILDKIYSTKVEQLALFLCEPNGILPRAWKGSPISSLLREIKIRESTEFGIKLLKMPSTFLLLTRTMLYLSMAAARAHFTFYESGKRDRLPNSWRKLDTACIEQYIHSHTCIYCMCMHTHKHTQGERQVYIWTLLWKVEHNYTLIFNILDHSLKIHFIWHILLHCSSKRALKQWLSWSRR